MPILITQTYSYEELIPDEERHRLGQFYTPPPIAELIVNWAIRTAKDVVLDPAVGSGTFPVKAYKRLMELKMEKGKTYKNELELGTLHKGILSQLYTDDINPFPAHLTSLNLAMRNVRNPTSEMNIIVEDFFNLRSRMEVFAPYVIKSPKGEIRRHIAIPAFDAIIANPPYTRGVEINKSTKKSIDNSIGEVLKDYKLSGGILNETGIYIHFIVHAFDFLKKHGRIGMIVSNSWLQTEYGICFCNYLLDHFKIKAIIDFNQRLFRIPLVATCVILLEREDDFERRNNNNTVFLYVNEDSKVDQILDAIDNPQSWSSKFLINTITQANLPKNAKWVKEFFDTEKIETALSSSLLLLPVSSLFEPRFGNIIGVTARGGTGADKFFYLSTQAAKKWHIPEEYLVPVLVRSRYSKFFTFTEEDWESVKNKGKPCYAFICHRPKNSLPDAVQEYIHWGETTELVRVREDEKPKTAIESLASMAREKARKKYFGWYDIGGVLQAAIYVSRRAQYVTRFVLSKKEKVALDDGFITLIPKKEMTQQQLSVTLAFLNSSIGRFFVEIYGRSTGGGVIELDDKSTGKIPLINFEKLSDEQNNELRDLFTKLENKTREIGNAETQQSLENLQSIIQEIDQKLEIILKLEHPIIEKILEITQFLYQRRVARTENANPESIKGEEEPKISLPKKVKKEQKSNFDRQITRWIENKSESASEEKKSFGESA